MSRIAPLQAPYPAAVQQDFERIMGPGREPLVLFRTIATQERAWKKFTAAGLLDKGPLPMREREIVIDRTCARNGCEYEWGVHAVAFGRPLGLNEAQLRATVHGSAADPCWSDRQRLLVRLVDELHDTGTISDELWAELAAGWEAAALVELVATVGFYHLVSFAANAFRVDLEEHAERFPA